jgi:hypothetical protein
VHRTGRWPHAPAEHEHEIYAYAERNRRGIKSGADSGGGDQHTHENRGDDLARIVRQFTHRRSGQEAWFSNQVHYQCTVRRTANAVRKADCQCSEKYVPRFDGINHHHQRNNQSHREPCRPGAHHYIAAIPPISERATSEGEQRGRAGHADNQADPRHGVCEIQNQPHGAAEPDIQGDVREDAR